MVRPCKPPRSSTARATASLTAALDDLTKVADLVGEVIAPSKARLMPADLVAAHDLTSRARIYGALAEAAGKVRRALRELDQ
jgi:hypothetical protein